ncbi:hypothetical protein PIB30_013797 [Stylosanthes scabra]|uniref:Uncharacterized protein n=1 Tax=Stylosanthes scabra TaxID=79078 RepID=A0ABU6R5H6_9FABA|nr:hypothetical protein [Stylosanthes scabra]
MSCHMSSCGQATVLAAHPNRFLERWCCRRIANSGGHPFLSSPLLPLVSTPHSLLHSLDVVNCASRGGFKAYRSVPRRRALCSSSFCAAASTYILVLVASVLSGFTRFRSVFN